MATGRATDVVPDTSAWIEYFREGKATIVKAVDACLDRNLVGIGDLIFCEIMQGLKRKRQRAQVAGLLLSPPRFDMVGFQIAERSAANYRLLRTRGVTVRKTIDVLIGTYCAENGFPLIHNDSDFDLMSKHIGLEVYAL